MNTNINNCRRSFLKKGLVLTAGFTFASSGLKLFANTTDDWRWVGYCGLSCDDSCSYFSNNQCPSCKSINYDCSVQKCAKSRKVPTCAHCADLEVCDEEFWVTHPDQYETMLELQESLDITDTKDFHSNKQKISIFPNPAKDYLHIKNPANNIMEFHLLAMNGKLVKSGMIDNTEMSINISDLKAGNYILKLQRNKVTFRTHKVVIH